MNSITVANIMREKTTLVTDSVFHDNIIVDNGGIELKSIEKFPNNVRVISVESLNMLKSKNDDTKVKLYFEIELTGGTGYKFLQVAMNYHLGVIYKGNRFDDHVVPFERHFKEGSFSAPVFGDYTYGDSGISANYNFKEGLKTIPDEINRFIKDPRNLYLTDDAFVDRILFGMQKAYNKELFKDVTKDELLTYDILHELRYRYTLNKEITETVIVPLNSGGEENA